MLFDIRMEFLISRACYDCNATHNYNTCSSSVTIRFFQITPNQNESPKKEVICHKNFMPSNTLESASAIVTPPITITNEDNLPTFNELESEESF